MKSTLKKNLPAIALIIYSSQAASEISWQQVTNGQIPPNAIQGGWETNGTPLAGGHEQGRILSICRAKHRQHFVIDKGVHPGKMVGDHCHYGYGGTELNTV